MKTETCLEIQASIDGELDAHREATLGALCTQDPEAKALREELANLRAALRSHEPEYRISDSREFYWGQIRRRIDQAERAEAAAPRKSLSSFSTMFRWLAPVAGLAAVTLVFSLRDADIPGPVAPDISSVVYRSDADGITVHWIN
jgi:anti-sigma factor RsiW